MWLLISGYYEAFSYPKSRPLEKKAAENRKDVVVKDKPADRSVPNATSRSRPVRLNPERTTLSFSITSNPKQRPINLRELPLERQVELTKKVKELVVRKKSPNTALLNASSNRQKPNLIKILQNRKPSKRRLLMERFSPTAIFADGLPTSENPLNPEGLDLAQTLHFKRVSNPLELYSKLLYGRVRLNGRVRLTRLDGTRFEADGEVFRGAGVPQGYFLLFRWFFDCCAADAQPFGIIVRSDDLNKAQPSFWVHVAGTMKFRTVGGKKIAYLEAETVQRIPTPPPEKRYITY
jgi:hypothetical protein